jgi:D-alanyl-lipoteichoic acid acyltransferase DltB (MBOAT superfamily)
MDLSGFLVNLIQIIIFILTTITIGLFSRGRWRGWAIFSVSVLAVFWLQPASAIRHLDFWFPSLSLSLTLLAWRVTSSPDRAATKDDIVSTGVVFLIPVSLGLVGILSGGSSLIPTRPPVFSGVLIASLAFGALFWVLNREGVRKISLVRILVIMLLGLFVVLKFEPFAERLSSGLRTLNGQATEHARGVDLSWLGFSYIAFRLLHTLRDREAKRLADVSLRDYVSYVLFFPALTAGPIDRLERFQADLQSPQTITVQEGLEGGRRIAVGIFKKFVLADGLALIALNSVNAGQTGSGFWMWILLYAFALRLYFDFSGYTDVAIGIGRLAGVTLPENFDRPYLKNNLAAFWNSWHITLAQWFRSYFFNPLARALRRSRISTGVSVFIAQISTMMLIGLWHGIATNFLIWGAWHGVGLYLHNRWTELQRTKVLRLPTTPRLKWAGHVLGVFLTFHFVLLGWVWFVLPDVGRAWSVFLKLFGA